MTTSRSTMIKENIYKINFNILSSEHNLGLLRFNVMIKLMLFVAKKIYADHKIDWSHGKSHVIMNSFLIEKYICSQNLLSVLLSEYSVIKREF